MKKAKPEFCFGFAFSFLVEAGRTSLKSRSTVVNYYFFWIFPSANDSSYVMFPFPS